MICADCSWLYSVYCLLTCFILCRDHAADVLFEDGGEDSTIPACILDALMKVSIVCLHVYESV